MQGDQGWAESSDGHELYWRRLPTDDTSAPVLLFVHGLAEHSGRYQHVMEHLASRGFDCWAFDCRGHGRSSGRRVHVKRFDDYLSDVQALHRLIREACPGRPLGLVGHSQGGLIALRHVLTYPDDFSALMVSSPFLGIHPDSRPRILLRAAARLLSMLAPGLLLAQSLNATLLSRDQKVGTAYLADPLVSNTVSARWFTEVVAAHHDTMQRAAQLRCPTLVMQSGADQLADPEATRIWARTAPAELVEYVEWAGFYHEMFNETNNQQVFDTMEQWLRARIE
jgi:alpha-beta hydrolase superfamily lysophospholipase